MLKISKIGETSFKQFPVWPPVLSFDDHDAKLVEPYLDMKSQEIRERLASKRGNYHDHANSVVLPLGVLYAHFYGYHDAPVFHGREDIDSELVRVKRVLETEMINHIFKPDLSEIDKHTSSPAAAVEYLRWLSKTNPGVHHRFFDYVRDEMSADSMKKFLWLETIRNEVVDDEVAMLVPGTQHAMKQVVSSNLWDECGNGKIDGFHTSWLIQLLNYQDQWDEFFAFRSTRPWFSMLTSHSFNSLLTTPGRNFAAYGTFLINESWVIEHFIRIKAGMNRLGIHDEDRRIYFEAHCNIDDHHTAELIEAISKQRPPLQQHQLRDLLVGAHQAIASALVMYENNLKYFKDMDQNDQVAQRPSHEAVA
jgi:hypothetical protein